MAYNGMYISRKCHATFTPIKGLSSLKGTCAQFTHTGGKGQTLLRRQQS